MSKKTRSPGARELWRLRGRLTAICAVGTSLVLAAMAFLGLRFSLAQLRAQYENAFDSALNSVFFYLQSQQYIDQTWLARTEASGELSIGVEKDGVPLLFTRQDQGRRQRVEWAEETARQEYGYDPAASLKNALSAETLQFTRRTEDGHFTAAVCKVPYQGSFLNVTVVKDRETEDATARSLVVFFVAAAALSAVALSGFAFVFAGRAIGPVAESQRRQVAFVSAASHELRSPLAVVRMGAETIRAMPDKAGECAELIERECTRMSRLIEDLLLLAGSDAGTLPAKAEAHSPKTLVLAAYERFGALAAEKGVALELDIPDGAPDVLCDEGRCQQILAVFMDNALAYTPKGGTVRLGVAPEGREAGLWVADSGPGVPEGDRRRIFERFYRADAARHEKEHYGLGLSVAAELARLLRGSIRVDEGPLGGARFTLLLKTAG